jgi:hypothetical protein
MLRLPRRDRLVPVAALSDYVTWEAIDDRSARATMRYGGVTASPVSTFDDAGDSRA